MGEGCGMAEFMRVEDLIVYQKLCQFHLDVCELTRTRPAEESIANFVP